jgi:hypothetical protein
MQTRLAVPLLAPLLVASLGACAAKVLTVGSGNGGSSSGSGETVTTQGSCTSASCANQSLTCVGGGAPTNLACIPHPDADNSIFMGTCILQGDCTTTGTSGTDASSGSSSTTGVATCVTTPLSSCGSDSDGAQVCSSSFGGSGIVTVEMDPAAGDAGAASTTLSAFFTGAQGGTSTQQTYGACVFDPYGASADTDVESGAQGPAPNPGDISIKASGFTGTLYPACDGTYASATSEGTPAAGSLVSLTWALPAGNPWQFPTSLPGVPAPHVMLLPAGSVFATSYPSDPPIVRVPAGSPKPEDLPVEWLAPGATGHLEELVFLMTQGMATLTCTFPAADGSGTIPVEALLQLAAGKVSYVVFSQTTQLENDADAEWQLKLAINAVATSPNGLAKGILDLE